MTSEIFAEFLQWLILLCFAVGLIRIVIWMAAVPEDFEERLRNLEKRSRDDGK